jgi:hypothetical protein
VTKGPGVTALSSQFERISVSTRSPIDVEWVVNEPIERPLAETVGHSTYFFIGQLATRTDLVPVYNYDPLAA